MVIGYPRGRLDRDERKYITNDCNGDFAEWLKVYERLERGKFTHPWNVDKLLPRGRSGPAKGGGGRNNISKDKDGMLALKILLVLVFVILSFD